MPPVRTISRRERAPPTDIVDNYSALWSISPRSAEAYLSHPSDSSWGSDDTTYPFAMRSSPTPSGSSVQLLQPDEAAGKGNTSDPSKDNFTQTFLRLSGVPPLEGVDSATAAVEDQGFALLVRLAEELRVEGDHRAQGEPESAGLLAPISIWESGRTSLNVPDSPTGSSSMHVQPSPTLSTARSSVQFVQPTSLSLRDNQPTERSGSPSLGLLAPGNGNANGRKGAVTSTFDGGAEDAKPDSRSIGTTTTAANLSPAVVRENSPPRSREHMKKVGSEGEEHGEGEIEADGPMLDLSQDEDIDAAPFVFKPVHLASLIDPKNLSSLRQMAGVQGLRRGLGTHGNHGLTSAIAASSSRHDDSSAGPGKTAAQGFTELPTAGPFGVGNGASQRHIKSPHGTPFEASPVAGDDGHTGDAVLGDPAVAIISDELENLFNASIYSTAFEDRDTKISEPVFVDSKTETALLKFARENGWVDSRTENEPGAADGPGGEYRRGEDEPEPEEEHVLLDALDEDVDVAPFAFGPSWLASLVDSKDIAALSMAGGVQGLLRGLGTHREHGLASIGAGLHAWTDDGRADIGAGEGETAGGAYSATIEDRYRVYGRNILRNQGTRSLLQLMLSTLQRKIFVAVSIVLCWCILQH